MFLETDSAPINQNISTIPQKKQKLKKVESTCREPLTSQRTSTYQRPFTCEGNYLVVHTVSEFWTIVGKMVIFSTFLTPYAVSICTGS